MKPTYRVTTLMVLGWVLAAGCSSIVRQDSNSSKSASSVRAAVQLKKGNKAVQHGNLDEARSYFERAILLDDFLGTAYNNLGLVHFQEGDLYTAAWSFERAIERMPENPEPHYNLGLAMEQGGQLGDAMQLFDTAFTLDPTDPRYLGNLVRVRLKQGETAAMVSGELQQLMMIETRPHWREWASDLLNYDALQEATDHAESASDDFLGDVPSREEPPDPLPLFEPIDPYEDVHVTP